MKTFALIATIQIAWCGFALSEVIDPPQKTFVPDWRVEVFAGDGTKTTKDGVGVLASFDEISSMAKLSVDTMALVEGERFGYLRIVNTNAEVKTVFTNGFWVSEIAVADENTVYLNGNSAIHKLARNGNTWSRSVVKSGSFGAIAFNRSSGHLWVADTATGDLCSLVPTPNSAVNRYRMFQGILSIWTDGTVVYVNERAEIRRFIPPSTVLPFVGSRVDGYADGFDSVIGASSIRMFPLKDGSGFVAADRGNHAIRLLRRDRRVTTLAGSGDSGIVDGPSDEARFNFPDDAIELANGDIIVSDSFNYRLRRIFKPTKPIPPPDLSIRSYPGVTIKGVIGRTYRIEATTDVDQQTGWTEVTRFALPKTPHTWFDETPGIKRFYRAVMLE